MGGTAPGRRGLTGSAHPFPRLRLAALAWLAAYVPSYAHAYGLLNFGFLCNLGVVVTALGILTGSALLVSSQAVAAPVICLVWMLDAGGRLVLGQGPFGLTDYMWDPQFPLFTRLLSCYHVVWPFVLLHGVRRLGYDRRGFALQAAIAALGVGLGRLAPAAANLNFAYVDPLFRRSWQPAALHLLIVYGGLMVLIYLPVHVALMRWSAARAVAPDGVALAELGHAGP